jgi:hypothetical protein
MLLSSYGSIISVSIGESFSGETVEGLSSYLCCSLISSYSTMNLSHRALYSEKLKLSEQLLEPLVLY